MHIKKCKMKKITFVNSTRPCTTAATAFNASSSSFQEGTDASEMCKN